MKEHLWAARIKARAKTILDVPENMREAVMDLLSDSDRRRMTALLETEE